MYTQQLEKIPTEDGKLILRGPCIVTGKPHDSPPVTPEQLAKYEGGEFAQVAFPHLSDAEREFLISGTSPEGWDALFPKGDED